MDDLILTLQIAKSVADALAEKANRSSLSAHEALIARQLVEDLENQLRQNTEEDAALPYKKRKTR